MLCPMLLYRKQVAKKQELMLARQQKTDIIIAFQQNTHT